ncbi:hypothetical protein E2562_032262 [Oryza meyeriana var. granulata]|uniref:Uncharacterized protein n=1 Tax=Oryza meyeriana var. granulata TaxID=110450 RepID=A0A6G1F0C8_9ORYZ|nr:hypothetical protein E2562_032262 [Oryza meyeriana var. granulata]
MPARWLGRVMTTVTIDSVTAAINDGTGTGWKRRRQGRRLGDGRRRCTGNGMARGWEERAATPRKRRQWQDRRRDGNMGKKTSRRRQPISEVAMTATDRDAAGRPRWEEEDVTDGNMGLIGSTGSRRQRRRLVGRDGGATMTTSGRTQNRRQTAWQAHGARAITPATAWQRGQPQRRCVGRRAGEEHRAPGTYDNSDEQQKGRTGKVAWCSPAAGENGDADGGLRPSSDG